MTEKTDYPMTSESTFRVAQSLEFTVTWFPVSGPMVRECTTVEWWTGSRERVKEDRSASQ